MKIKIFKCEGEGSKAYFWCPACNELHVFNIERSTRPCWTFNGDLEKPTFNPSLLYPDKIPLCHLFLHEGKISYCSDCGHEFRNKVVDLPDLPDWIINHGDVHV